MPAHLVDVAPRLVEFENGKQAWAYEDKLFPNIGLNAVAGRPQGRVEHGAGALRRDAQGLLGHPRPHRRHGHSPASGPASASRRSSPASPVSRSRAATTRSSGSPACAAWNDWHHEVWAGTYPERMIPLQLVWLRDPQVAADDVRRNAERGFRAITFPESMNNIGLPSVHTDHWDPLLRACEETGTVVCIHTGSRDRSRRRRHRSRRSSRAPRCSLCTACSPRPTGCGPRSRSATRRSTSRSRKAGSAGCRCSLDRLDYVMAHSASGMSGTWTARPLPVGSGPAQLLVLLHRRPDDPAGARPHRRRPHHGGERLSPRRLDVARHPGPAGRAPRRPPRRRRGQAHPRERRPALPPPPAAGGVGV